LLTTNYSETLWFKLNLMDSLHRVTLKHSDSNWIWWTAYNTSLLNTRFKFHFIFFPPPFKISIPGKGSHFLLRYRVQTGSGPTQPPILWISGFFPGGKATRAWSWPLAEIKNTWNYASTHTYVSMAWYLLKYRDKFTLALRAVCRGCVKCGSYYIVYCHGYINMPTCGGWLVITIKSLM